MGYFRTAILLAAMTALFHWASVIPDRRPDGLSSRSRRRGDEPVRLLAVSPGWCGRCMCVRSPTSARRPSFTGRCGGSRRTLGLPMPKVYIMGGSAAEVALRGPRDLHHAAVAADRKIIERRTVRRARRRARSPSRSRQAPRHSSP